MARLVQLSDLPIFTKEETGVGYRFAAFFSYNPIGLLVFWIIFHKKNKFVRMHCKYYWSYLKAFIVMAGICVVVTAMSAAATIFTFKISGISIDYITSGDFLRNIGPGDPVALLRLLEAFLLYVFILTFILALGTFCSVAITVCSIILLVHAIMALCGKVYTKSGVRKTIFEQLSINNPEAVALIHNDPKYADILAQYRVTHPKKETASTDGSSNQ